MGKKKGSFKDFLYDSMDYIMIFSIILVVVGIISWRLNILFDDANIIASSKLANEVSKNKESSKKDEKKPVKKTVEKKKSTEAEKKKTVKKEDKAKDTAKNASNKNDAKLVDEKDKVKEADQEKDKTGKVVEVNIPQGSDSSKIADILQTSGAVKDSKEFLKKCEEMDKSTRLKAGDFEIPKGTSLEEVINIITK